ncbi:type II toxin-antitoxin system HicB family antitoxin [Deltaproteobacteria bacterium OttesenSCG-928-M10]|nr:type II toxin-antitoxin system HicB family antitoxin [Deltaproteobacteria bacterium OttesenSCG-928-M10]
MKKEPHNKFELTPLTEMDGGGWMITFPDLPGCMSDGETIKEAIANGAEAEAAWLSAADKWGRPKPKSLVTRLPLSLHRDLKIQARAEGSSLNTLIVTLLSQGVTALKGRGDGE